MADSDKIYDPNLAIWPDLKQGQVLLRAVRVGVDRRTGKMIVGWDHVVQSMEVIFATRYHERVLRRWVGSFVPHLLGDSLVMRVVARFYWAIATSLDLWEPCYSVLRIVVQRRETDDTAMNPAENIRLGHLTTKTNGVYKPRGHLGDPTPEDRRSVGLINSGGIWRRG